MRKRFRTLIVFLLVITLTVAAAPAAFTVTAADTVTIAVSGTENYYAAFTVLELVNEQRTANGLRPLVMNPVLLDGAMLRAAEVLVNFDHTRPNGTSCFTAIPRFSAMGENIAYGYGSAAAVVQAWMNSPGHRANILNPSYDSLGVGVFSTGRQLGWVQMFAAGGAGNAVTRTEDLRDAARPFAIVTGGLKLSVNRYEYTLKETEQYTLEILGNNLPLAASCLQFSSGDPGVATVTAEGTVTAVKTGTTVIRATVPGGPSLAVTVHVKQSRGDVNKDGLIDSTDARLTLQYAVRKIPSLEDAFAADVDGNGKVDSTDARLILQFAVRKIGDFPT